jgi:molecular chaperone DnaK
LHVTARDKATAKEQSVKITASTNLDKDEVDRLVREAKSHEADDRMQREQAEARNSADTLVDVTEKALRDLGDKLPVNDRGQRESTIEELKAALNANDLGRIRQLTEQLQQASHALTQQMYQQAGATNGAAPSGSTEGQSGGEDDVVEGEYRQV